MAGIARRKLFSVTHYDPARAFKGYTYFDPFWEQNRGYLIDMEGRIVHYWDFPGASGDWTQLLPDGHLLVPVRKILRESPRFPGFCGAWLHELDWDGNVIWKYEDDYQHHTFARLANGNYMILRVVPTPDEIARKVRGGIPPEKAMLSSKDVAGSRGEEEPMWSDSFREVTPEGKVVWEWLAYEHLDPEEDVICAIEPRDEWTHGNSIFELPNGDIMTTFRVTHTIYIIDRSGGSGRVKWKWGPGEIYHPHNPTLLDNGNILVFDNGVHRPDSYLDYSRVIEVNPETREVVWEYKGDPVTDFYSTLCAGCQRLPNGNTLICETTQGRIFEVTREGDIVWEYNSPFYSHNQDVGEGNRDLGRNPWIHRATRFAPDCGAFKGRDLDPERFSGVNALYGPDAFRK